MVVMETAKLAVAVVPQVIVVTAEAVGTQETDPPVQVVVAVEAVEADPAVTDLVTVTYGILAVEEAVV
jgi:hypothetical protein